MHKQYVSDTNRAYSKPSKGSHNVLDPDLLKCVRGWMEVQYLGLMESHWQVCLQIIKTTLIVACL